jgi:regulator of sirC expression with transglutaminase-like and TPR domain
MESYIIENGIFDYDPDIVELDYNSPLLRLKELAAKPDEEIDLAEAALLIAASEYEGLNWGHYLNKLDVMADDVMLLRAGESDPQTNIKILNDYLFGTLHFTGNQDEYNDPRNSYLNDVLERRTGIPISLSLVYMEVGKRAGMPIEGIGLPGHFIVRYNYNDEYYNRTEQILLDPFNGGTSLSEEDCARMVNEIYHRPMSLTPVFMRPVTKKQFITRMLNNLKTCYVEQEDFQRALRVERMLMAVSPEDWDEVRDRGAIHFRAGKYWKAIYDFQSYLRHTPDAKDGTQIRNYINGIYKEITSRN